MTQRADLEMFIEASALACVQPVCVTEVLRDRWGRELVTHTVYYGPCCFTVGDPVTLTEPEASNLLMSRLFAEMRDSTPETRPFLRDVFKFLVSNASDATLRDYAAGRADILSAIILRDEEAFAAQVKQHEAVVRAKTRRPWYAFWRRK